MAFNKDINGYKNEYEFADYLNNKRIVNINPLFMDLFNNLFGHVSYYDRVYVWKNHRKEKTDIFIKINKEVRKISIKKGVKNSVHVEHIYSFIDFLEENNVSRRTINNLLKYLYADGSIDGTGKKRLSTEEYVLKHKREIANINKELNTDVLLDKFIDRFVITGNLTDQPIDAIIYGVVEDFIWISREEIYKIIKHNKNIQTNSIHFGSLFFQPMARCLNYNTKYEKFRNYVQIKWYHLSDDIIYMMNERCYKKIDKK